MNSIVLKPWGSYQVIEEGKNFKVKKIIVKPKGQLSLQSHNYRSEHWVIVEGRAEVTVNEAIKILEANQSIVIPLKAKHRLANNDENDLVVIEVWYGDILDEDDLTRYQDKYNRN